jgi:acetyltransferase
LGIQNLNCFFNPKAIAVIGASEDKDALGARILCNLIGSYKGLIFPVNPFRQTIQGITAYSNINKIPNKIDLAIIATPAHTVPQIVEECGKAQVSGVIIVSAGFSECDPEGESLTRQILEHRKTYGIRIIGPNSLGVIRPKNGLYATFGDKKAMPGKIAFISQSAALCGTVLDWSQETKVGLSAVVAIGSTIDVDIGDLIDYFGADPQTRAIMLYVESIKNIRSFISSARGFARTKPIVIVKAGRSNESHSFKLSSISKLTKDTVYDAVFRRIGIVRVKTINELFDCAKALSMQPNPCSPSLTIVTNAGGPGLLAADQLALRGGQLSQVSKTSLMALRSILPNYCGVSNPIDILEEATLERFRNVLQVCFTDPASGSILVIHSPQGVTNPYNIAKSVLELSEYNNKTLLVSLMGEDSNCQEARRMLNLNGIPTFKAPEEAVLAFMNMYSYTNNLESLYQTPEEIELNLGDPVHLKPLIRRAFCEGRHVLNLPESFALLNAYNIPPVKSCIVKTAEEASVKGFELSYPVTQCTLNQKTEKN